MIECVLRKMRGILIAFEGVDGTGKSTQINLLKYRLNATVFKFPDRTTPSGKILDEHLKKKSIIDGKTEHLLQSANRAEKEYEIIKKLNRGQIVLLDRYFGSGICYTSAKPHQEFNLPNQETLFQWSKHADFHLLEPDITFFFKSSAPYYKETEEIYETSSFLEKVQKNFDDLSKEKKWNIINIDDFWMQSNKLNKLLFQKIKEKALFMKNDFQFKFNN